MKRLMQGAKATPFNGLSINTHAKLEDILELPPVPIQRDHLRRVKKMSQIFEKDLKCQKVYTIVHIPDEIIFEEYKKEYTIKPGYYVLDGNTRCEFYRQNPKIAPSEVIANIMTIDNIDDLKSEYNGYDSQDAVEGKSQKIQGAIRLLNLQHRLHGRALNGGYGIALDKAYPHDIKDSLIDKVAFFSEEIVIMSETNIFEISDKYFKNAQFYSACLMLAKKHSARQDDVKKLFSDISKLADKPQYGILDKEQKNGMAILLQQKVDPNDKWFTFDTITNERFPKPISFFLFCLTAEMTHRKYDTGYLKPSLWYNAKKNLYDMELEALSTLFPQV